MNSYMKVVTRLLVLLLKAISVILVMVKLLVKKGVGKVKICHADVQRNNKRKIKTKSKYLNILMHGFSCTKSSNIFTICK